MSNILVPAILPWQVDYTDVAANTVLIVSGVSSGLVSYEFADFTTATVTDTTDKRYVTDAQLAVLGNTSGTNTGDQDLSGKADLVGGVVPSSQLPALVVTDVYTVADEAAMVALEAEQGDLAIRSDGAGTFVRNGNNNGDVTDWSRLNAPTDLVTSINGLIGAVALGYADVGAAAAVHTHAISDVTSLQTTLDGKVNTSAFLAAGDLLVGPSIAGQPGRLAKGANDTFLGVRGGVLGYYSAQTICQALNLWYTLAHSATAVTLTGTTAETATVTVTIPGNSLGPSGIVRVWFLATWTASTNTKTVRVRYPGLAGSSYVAYQSASGSANTTNARPIIIRNRGTAAQIGEANAGAIAGNQNNITTSAADTTAATDLVISGQLANAGESITIESYLVEILYGA